MGWLAVLSARLGIVGQSAFEHVHVDFSGGRCGLVLQRNRYFFAGYFSGDVAPRRWHAADLF